MDIYIHHLLVRKGCSEIKAQHTCRVDWANRMPKEAFTISQTVAERDKQSRGGPIFKMRPKDA